MKPHEYFMVKLGPLKIMTKRTKSIKRRKSTKVFKRFKVFSILPKLNNKQPAIFNKERYTFLKDKYSFFSHFFYRKNVLRKLLRIRVFKARTTQRLKATKAINLNLFDYYKYTSLPYKRSEQSKEVNDFTLQRIRFKPGYQIIWRRARKNLQELLDLKLLYQKKLTRHLTKFYRLAHANTVNMDLITLERLVLLSKLLPDPSTIKLFIQNKYLFINGMVPKTQKLIVFTGDFLQLRLSSWVSIYLNFVDNWYKSKFNRLKTLAKLKIPTKNIETNKLFRTRTTKIPAKFLNFVNLETVIPNFLEVDFFTKSVFILDKSKSNTVIDNRSKVLSRVNIFKNYNWKYLN